MWWRKEIRKEEAILSNSCVFVAEDCRKEKF